MTFAGGSGKSELVRQYASQFRVQYPGGVFQIDMETHKTWDDAFLGILKGTANNGVKVADYLDLKTEKDDASDIDGAAVRDALLKRSRTAGPILLVLDNVEGCAELLGEEGAFVQAFPAGFSEKVQVNVMATARTCDAVLGENDWAQVFALGDLSSEAALELLFAEKKAESDEERQSARRVAELLGRRALFLRRVPAILKGVNKKARIVCRSYAKLAEALEKDALGTIGKTETLDASYMPARLWEIVQGNLAEWGLGEACIKLVKLASYFSPDGFSKNLLRYLWDQLVYPGLEDWGSAEEVFDQAVDLLKSYNLFQSTDPVRLHRLDRAAILQTAKTDPALDDALGATLASYGRLLKQDWAFLLEHEKIRTHLPDALMHDGGFWVSVLCERPNLADKCPWDSLSGDNWRRLLCRRPEFSDRCEWNKLSGSDLRLLLWHRPQFSDRCQWGRLEGQDWAFLLRERPQFADHCLWEKLNGLNWARLLRVQPQFADRCPVAKQDGNYWSVLLATCPQFAERCPWDKLSGEDWERLLLEQPQFGDRCPWEKLANVEWSELLCRHPQFADRCPWDNISDIGWGRLLVEQPQFANCCPWGSLRGGAWRAILCKSPQFIGKCPRDLLDGRDWMYVLLAQPQLIDYCPCEKLGASEWLYLLAGQPQLADHCPWESLDEMDWGTLLGEQPQFAIHCPWDRIKKINWGRLIRKQPQVFEQIDFSVLSGAAWASLVIEQVHFADRCPWWKLDGEAWEELLCAYPQYAEHCMWDKLDGESWGGLLSAQPRFADHCAWNKLDGVDWSTLLSLQPQFADFCSWEKMNEWNWLKLLRRQPQFANRCTWKRFVTFHWKTLLREQPGIFENIDKFGGHCRCAILMIRPQFAEKWSMEELADRASPCWANLSDIDFENSWKRLIAAQPQFAKWREGK